MCAAQEIEKTQVFQETRSSGVPRDRGGANRKKLFDSGSDIRTFTC